MDSIRKFFSSNSPKKHKRPSVTKKSLSTTKKSPLMVLSPIDRMMMPNIQMHMIPSSVQQRTGRYHSEQMHSQFVNGVTEEKQQIVDVNGNKGTKTVIITRNGKTKKSVKQLSTKEIECIRRCEFVPGLFKDCEECIR
jgi:hypothetical protein